MHGSILLTVTCLIFFALLDDTNAWSGRVCYRQKLTYYTYRRCGCWLWGICLYTRSFTRARYVSDPYCCPGWRHNGNLVCDIPICSPNCASGQGVCVSPNTCRCNSGYEGELCNGIAKCSHLNPCYPGRCSRINGQDECVCSDGFLGTTCLKFQGNDFKPAIEKANATFAFYSYTKKEYAYNFMTDSTNSLDTDFVWMNQEEFNQIKFDIDASFDAIYEFKHCPLLPIYIRSASFGIVGARVDVEHKKLGPSGIYVANTETFNCKEPSNANPIANRVMECRLNGTNIIQIDSGDKYTLTYTVTTGGVRQLINPDTNALYATQYFTGETSINKLEYRFDYDPPVHCADFNNCTGDDVPLKLNKDITKGPVQTFWKGWSDRQLSGVTRYAVEFVKMEYSTDYNGLREPDILPDFNPVPQFITEIPQSSVIDFPVYTPTEPGVYSVILEVADMANNSRYARRFVIFDSTSDISLDSNKPLYATSASPDSRYTWQVTPNSDDGAVTTLSVSWEGHFVNELHERNHFLSKILDYTPRLSDDIKRIDYKRIDPQFDDNEGERTKDPISNINSIVKFEIFHGTESTQAPQSGWQTITPLKETETFILTGVNIRSGDSRQVWVRATDVMGNTRIDSTTIHFDSSPPLIWDPTFSRNVKNASYHFSSRIVFIAKDDHSGLKKVSFKFTINSTGEITKQQDFNIDPVPEHICKSQPKDCYCITKGECFYLEKPLDINNCWLKVPIDRVKDEIHKVDITVYNLAMLSTTTTYTIGMVNNLDGIKDYFSPTNITILQTTDTSLRLSWVQAPTCYDRAGIIIRLFLPNNSTKDYKAHKDATTFDLTGLSPTTKYWFQLYTRYGNDTRFVTSNPSATLRFTTAEASRGFPPGGVAGLSTGFIIIIIIVAAVLVFLGRTGRLQPAKAKVTQGFRTIRETIRVRSSNTYRRPNTGYKNRAYSTNFDDDIYYYGQMDVKIDDSLILSRKHISLEDELTRGRFAVIYLAKYYGNRKEEQTVIAKVIKDDQKAENVMKMKAKINFYVEKVGHHKNVMDFIGYVEDDVRGPFMILEYCQNGVLKDFLIAQRENVTLDLEERLFRMVYGVCLGMDYLSSKGVVHRRLAARNILLNHMYEPKIAGFGPDPSQDEDEGEERIPIKWMAPECMKTTKNANELSDVFSFGVVMWEIFSLGDTPYPGIQGREVPKRQKQGYKMKRPEYCDDSFYKIMLKCWHFDPNKRAGFSQIKDELTSLFQEGPGDEYYYRSNEI